MANIKSRLDRLEEARGDGRPSLIIYEADADLSAEDEAAFITAAVPDISPSALVVGIRRLAVTEPTVPRIVQIGSAGLTHEEALKHLR